MDILIKSRKTVLAITFHRGKEQNQNTEYTLFFTSAYHLEINRKKNIFINRSVILKIFFSNTLVSFENLIKVMSYE